MDYKVSRVVAVGNSGIQCDYVIVYSCINKEDILVNVADNTIVGYTIGNIPDRIKVDIDEYPELDFDYITKTVNEFATTYHNYITDIMNCAKKCKPKRSILNLFSYKRYAYESPDGIRIVTDGSGNRILAIADTGILIKLWNSDVMPTDDVVKEIVDIANAIVNVIKN